MTSAQRDRPRRCSVRHTCRRRAKRAIRATTRKPKTLFQQALAGDGDDVDAMVGLGTLALARHEFAAALDWGEQARALAPYHAAAYGVIGDAQVELGRYDEAIETVQAMVDLRPDLSSYSRVSYLRELMGDREGALVAMEQAATAGSGYAENVAWVRVQLGNLRFDGGDLAGAASEYAAALAALPGYAPGTRRTGASGGRSRTTSTAPPSSTRRRCGPSPCPSLSSATAMC